MSKRVWSPIAKRMVPAHDPEAVAAYLASDLCQMDNWLAAELDYYESLEVEEVA